MSFQQQTNSETLEQQKSNSWTPVGRPKTDHQATANLTESLMPKPTIIAEARPTGMQLNRSAKLLTVIGLTTKHADYKLYY